MAQPIFAVSQSFCCTQSCAIPVKETNSIRYDFNHSDWSKWPFSIHSYSNWLRLRPIDSKTAIGEHRLSLSCSFSFICFTVKETTLSFHYILLVFYSQFCFPPPALLTYNLLWAENKTPRLTLKFSFFITQHNPSSTLRLPLIFLSSFHTFILHVVQLKSMTSGLSPWRTNHAFHSGSKREVPFLCFISALVACSVC